MASEESTLKVWSLFPGYKNGSQWIYDKIAWIDDGMVLKSMAPCVEGSKED